MTTGMAWCPVSNMGITKNKVISGTTWCPISHRVTLKEVFLNLLKIEKINNKSRLRYELYTFSQKLLENFYYYQKIFYNFIKKNLLHKYIYIFSVLI